MPGLTGTFAGGTLQAMPNRPGVAVAGATGFVGQALVRAICRDFRVTGLARTPPPPEPGLDVEWRRCDLFSLMQVEKALEGAEQAVYLVHSMMPSARLTQGSFQDMDLICADNFARAAARAGVKHIAYLGGIIPDVPELSRHLRSRLEVETVLGSRGVPVTALRAGIVIGPGGSSYRIFKTLIEKVPVLLCPTWAGSLTQPVALADVLLLLRYCLDHPARENCSHDIGSPDVMSYRELLERTARIMGLRRRFLDVPLVNASWSRDGLCWVTGAPRALVAPLLESTKHPMVARRRRWQEAAGVPGVPFEAAVRAALAGDRTTGKAFPPRRPRHGFWASLHRYDVRSVQRMPLPPGRSARWAAQEYSAWLPLVFRRFLKAEVDVALNVRFRLVFPRISLLELSFAHDRSLGPDRHVLYITGGILARKLARSTSRSRLEFREVLNGTTLVVAIHDYRPTLPWPIYACTQAWLHLWVMRKFAKHLTGLAGFLDTRA